MIKKAFTLSEGASYGTMFNGHCIAAFTLAEVLITLGIIGIVAAMTLPTIIQKYHQKVMENAFKKSYASLQTAINSLSPDTYATLSGSIAGGSTVFFDDLFKQYKIIENNNNVARSYYDSKTRIWNIKTYIKKSGSYNSCAGLPSKIIYDGSAIGATYNCFSTWIVIDTNGPLKGPNALGHDIFYFTLSNKGKIIPVGSQSYSHWEMRNNSTFCSKNSTHAQNGASCAAFAVENRCPDDSSKSYWECLP